MRQQKDIERQNRERIEIMEKYKEQMAQENL